MACTRMRARMARLNDVNRISRAGDFARLLARLDPEPDRAAIEYERLHRTLVRFFDWRGEGSPEECADDVLDRLARKLHDTAVDDVGQYAHGIARMVLLERRRGPRFVSIETEVDLSAVPDHHSTEESPVGDRLDHCLAQLAPDERNLVLQYYEGERSAKIANRRQLAATLGLSDTALRSRVQRIRDRLERCIDARSARIDKEVS